MGKADLEQQSKQVIARKRAQMGIWLRELSSMVSLCARGSHAIRV